MTHEVLGTRIEPPFPDGLERAIFGLGCFWGAERVFWYHQHYLADNPNGYCGLGGTGVACPVGVAAAD